MQLLSSGYIIHVNLGILEVDVISKEDGITSCESTRSGYRY